MLPKTHSQILFYICKNELFLLFPVFYLSYCIAGFVPADVRLAPAWNHKTFSCLYEIHNSDILQMRVFNFV